MMPLAKLRDEISAFLGVQTNQLLSTGVRLRTQEQALSDLSSTTSIAGAFPKGCIPLGCSARVDTTIVTTAGDDGDEWTIYSSPVTGSGRKPVIRKTTVSIADLTAGQTAATVLPAGAVPIAVEVVVDTAITTDNDNTFDVGDGSDGDAFGAGLTSGAAGAIPVNHSTWTVDPASLFPGPVGGSSVDVVFTPVGDGASFTAGAVTVIGYYMQIGQDNLVFGTGLAAAADTIVDTDDWDVDPLKVYSREAHDIIVAPESGSTFDSGAVTVRWSYLEIEPLAA